WVYPQSTHKIDIESTGGTSGMSGEKYFLFPYWGGKSGREAGAGVSIGTNGVSVYEHANLYMPAVLVWQGALNGWNHIAIVYRNKQPSLYVNGELKRTGLTSKRDTVYLAMDGSVDRRGIAGGPYGSFKGLVGETKIYNGALPAEEIKYQFETERSKYSTTSKAAAGEETKSSASSEATTPLVVDDTEGPVLYYKFNEGSGYIVKDLSNQGNDGVIAGNAVWKTDKSVTALLFDGVDDTVYTPKHFTSAVNDFTFEAWIYPMSSDLVYPESLRGNTGLTGPKYLFFPSWGGDSSTGRAGVGLSVGTNAVNVYEHAVAYYPVVLSWQGDLNGWKHIALVYKNRQPNLYVNGQLMNVGLTGLKNAVYLGMEGPDTRGIGGHEFGHFKGLIGEIGIYNRALSGQEINAQYQSEADRYV
ncbi:MAG: hypothetical protein NTZ34_04875, partial [Chloroflexi bacterium]|nr:hypothetical protein [Chloroflexota bacterium]